MVAHSCGVPLAEVASLGCSCVLSDEQMREASGAVAVPAAVAEPIADVLTFSGEGPAVCCQETLPGHPSVLFPHRV